jgi:hypothetical protein
MRRTCLFAALLLFSLASTLPAQVLWTPVQEIGRTTVTELLAHDGVLYAGTAEVVYRSDDGGVTWYRPDRFPKTDFPPDVAALYAADGRVFSGTVLNGVYVTSDRGKNWAEYSDGLSGDARRVYGLTARGDMLYAATDGAGIWARNLRGTTPWQPFNEGLRWTGSSDLATYRNKLATVISEFCYTQDAGAWRPLPWNEMGYQKSTRALHAHGPYLFAGTATGLYRWDGEAPAWERRTNAPAPTRPVSALCSTGDTLVAVVQLTLGRHLLIASADAGESWTTLDDTQGEVHAVTAAGGRYWTARTDGLWFRPIDAPTGADEPAEPIADGLKLYTPYPHPSASGATITFRIDRAAPVALRILDALGRVVLSLAEAMQYNAGLNTVTADLRALTPGWYLVRLSSDTEMVSRPLLHR